jgi:hypothetical protein
MMPLLAVALLAMQAASPPPPAEDNAIFVEGKPYGQCGPPFAPVYIAPMGEPFRTNGTSDPMKHWFDKADRDHDGRLTPAELVADAQAFAETLDKDRDGVLDPQEVSDYENFVAPEIKLYQADQHFFRPPPRKSKDKRKAKDEARQRAAYQTALGAGRYASLNIPEPIASADLDIDRGVSRDEIAAVATQRFPLLDAAHRGYLTYDTLPKSPAQQDIDACRAKEETK